MVTLAAKESGAGGGQVFTGLHHTYLVVLEGGVRMGVVDNFTVSASF